MRDYKALEKLGWNETLNTLKSTEILGVRRESPPFKLAISPINVGHA